MSKPSDEKGALFTAYKKEGEQPLSLEDKPGKRLCRNCIHYEVCYIAKELRDFYNSIPYSHIFLAKYNEMIEWAQAFAEFCLKFEMKKGVNSR